VANVQRLRSDIERGRRLMEAATDSVTKSRLSEHVRELEAALRLTEKDEEAPAPTRPPKDDSPDSEI
jgi:hypothetical protein